MSTQAIETHEQIIAEFLKPPDEGGAYTDERLAMLLAHAQDGKLSYYSCCCLRGVPSADHALKGTFVGSVAVTAPTEHRSYLETETPTHRPADLAFHALSKVKGTAEEYRLGDLERCAKLIPLIEAEMRRRALKSQAREMEEVAV